jgi:hypothetical protein
MKHEFSDLPYRVAISETHLRKLKVEEFCNKQQHQRLKADNNLTLLDDYF